MRKSVLIIYYSQSGQLGEILKSFALPFVSSEIVVETVRVRPPNDFNFPWTSDTFFDAMPESVLGTSMELGDVQLTQNKYDLVIFGYQPWFLNPSIPSVSILHHPIFKRIIKNTPVITIIGARNMWLNAQEKVKKCLRESEANLVGNLAFVDKNNNQISAITIVYWMLTGKKDKMLGIFPKPGVAEEDINKAEIFGRLTLECLISDQWDGLQKKLVDLKAVEVKSSLMFIESRGGRLFSIWAKLISKRTNRTFWLRLFKYYLVVALFIVAPVVLTINNIFFKPFLGRVINKKKQYYLGLK